MASSIPKKKAFVNTNYCVACGLCMNTCPLKAISINAHIYAEVDPHKCVGCGKCAKVCPASTINIQ